MRKRSSRGVTFSVSVSSPVSRTNNIEEGRDRDGGEKTEAEGRKKGREFRKFEETEGTTRNLYDSRKDG